MHATCGHQGGHETRQMTAISTLKYCSELWRLHGEQSSHNCQQLACEVGPDTNENRCTSGLMLETTDRHTPCTSSTSSIQRLSAHNTLALHTSVLVLTGQRGALLSLHSCASTVVHLVQYCSLGKVRDVYSLRQHQVPGCCCALRLKSWAR